MAHYELTIVPHTDVLDKVTAVIRVSYGYCLERTDDPSRLLVEMTASHAEVLERVSGVTKITLLPGSTTVTIHVKPRQATTRPDPWIIHLPGVTMKEVQGGISLLEVNTLLITLTGLQDYLNDSGYDIIEVDA